MEGYSIWKLLVPRPCSFRNGGRSLWANLDQVSPPLSNNGLYDANRFSPGPETLDPFHLISTNPTDIVAMQKAEKNPHLVMLSDWDHLTAAEYQKVQVDSGINIL